MHKSERHILTTVIVLTVCTMLPVTGVVPILKQLIKDHYAVGDLATSLFMSVNMVGALLGAPVLGWLADRKGWFKSILVMAALVDAGLWWLLYTRPAFVVLMGLRLLEGAAHIGVLTMLMTFMSSRSEGEGRRARMAGLGGGIMFGIALGSPLGGVLGKIDILLPLQAGAGVMVLVAVVAWSVLPSGERGGGKLSGPHWSKMLSRREMRLPYLFGFVDRFTIGVFIIAFMLYTAHLGLGPRTTGFLIGAFMIPFAALSYPMGKLAERYGLWRFVLGGSFAFGCAYAAVAWLEGPLLWLDMVVCGCLSAVMFGPNLMLVNRAATPELRGSAMAGFNAAGSLGFLVGPVTAGALLEILGYFEDPLTTYRIVFAVIGATEVLCVGWGIFRLWRTERD
jgi:MFS family permease